MLLLYIHPCLFVQHFQFQAAYVCADLTSPTSFWVCRSHLTHERQQEVSGSVKLLPVPLSGEALQLLPQLFQSYVCEGRAEVLQLLLIQLGLAGIATHYVCHPAAGPPVLD
jgi:hypothetical protein